MVILYFYDESDPPRPWPLRYSNIKVLKSATKDLRHSWLSWHSAITEQLEKVYGL